MTVKKYNWAVEQTELRRVVGTWIDESMKRNRNPGWWGVHDEGTFMHRWFDFYRLSGRKEILDFLLHMLDYCREWQKEAFYHGYWKKGEAHHETEAFLFFLNMFWPVTGDPEHVEMTEDAAHHVGNWIEGVPARYDYKSNRFRSWYCGTQIIDDKIPHNYDSLDCWRYVLLGLNAYQANRKERYIEFARTYGRSWQEEIYRKGHVIRLFRFPIDDLDVIDREYFTKDNIPLSFHHGANRYAYKYGKDWQEGLEGYRYLYDYSAIMANALIDLWRLTGEDEWRHMVQRMIEIPKEKWGKFWACARLSAYHQAAEVTGDTTDADSAAASVQHQIEPLPDCFISMWDPNEEVSRNISAIRQSDGSAVPYQNSARVLYQAAVYLDDLELQVRAYKLAGRILSVAMPVLRDGREHGCSGVSYLSGPGGAAGEFLNDTALGISRIAGCHQPAVLYWTDGTFGLADDVAAICRLHPTRRVTLANTGKTMRKVMIKPQTKEWKKQATSNGKSCEKDASGGVLVTLNPGEEKTVAFGNGT